MVSKKFIICSLMFVCLFSFLNGETIKDGSLKAPGSKKVILVGKVSLKNPIDLEARREAFKTQSILQIMSTPDNFYVVNDKFLSMENWADYGETFFFETKLEKDNTFNLEYFTGAIFARTNGYFQFLIPASVTVHVPEDAKYVYIGNFEYELDYALRVVGFNHYDEYSKAQEEVNRATGKTVELVRAGLSFE